MKRMHTLIPCGIVLVLSVFLWGCSSTPTAHMPALEKEEIPPASWTGPDGSTLVFGYVYRQELLVKLGFHQLDFIQVNPAFGPFWMSAGLQGKVFYLMPIPTGASAHMVYYRYVSGDYTYTSDLSFRKDQDVTIDTAQPGLLYAGSWEIKPGPNDDLLPGSKYKFIPSKYGSELAALKAIAPAFAGTAWEPVINSRIEVLEDEKK